MPENKTKIDPTREYKKAEQEGEDENENLVSRPVETEDMGKPSKTDDTDQIDENPEEDSPDADDEPTGRQPRIEE